MNSHKWVLWLNDEKGAIFVEPKIVIYERHSDKISQGGGGVHCVRWSQADSHQVDRSWGFELWQVSTGWHWTRHHSIYHILRYTSLCDVWSFGVLAWEIFSKGGTPYQGMTNTRARELIDSGYRMPAPDGTPDEVYQLMLRWSAHKVNIHRIWTQLSGYQVLAIRPRRPAPFCWDPCNCRSSLFPVRFCVTWVTRGCAIYDQ